MGYMNETPVSRFFRDSRLISIGGGADEVMLGIIAKTMGTLSKPPAAPKSDKAVQAVG
jgi:citronellyl-CoA dehydrogenase